jgi:hypothetical protein
MRRKITDLSMTMKDAYVLLSAIENGIHRNAQKIVADLKDCDRTICIHIAEEKPLIDPKQVNIFEVIEKTGKNDCLAKS